MRERLAPFLFVGEKKQAGAAAPVGPAGPSEAGNRKDTSRRTLEGDHPPNRFEELLESLEGGDGGRTTDGCVGRAPGVGGEHAEAVAEAGVSLAGNQTAPGTSTGIAGGGIWGTLVGSGTILADRNVTQPAAAVNADKSPSPALSVPHVSPAASGQVSQAKNHSVKVRFSGSGNPSEGPIRRAFGAIDRWIPTPRTAAAVNVREDQGKAGGSPPADQWISSSG